MSDYYMFDKKNIDTRGKMSKCRLTSILVFKRALLVGVHN